MTDTQLADSGVSVSVPTTKAEVLASFDPGDFAVPGGREEEWRFAPLRRLRSLLTPGEATVPWNFTLGVSTKGTSRVAVASESGSAESGWHCATVQRDAPEQLAPSPHPLIPIDLPSALAWKRSQHAELVTISDRAVIDEPIVVTVSADEASHGMLLVRAGEASEATVIVVHRGAGMLAENIEIVAGDGAHLTVVLVQLWERTAQHLGRIHADIGRDASVKQIVATFGGDTVRLVSTAAFSGPGGSLDSLGAYFADAGQHLEHRLFVDHNQPHCRSNVNYRGALQGQDAHTVWVGDVLIRATAVGTDTYEINRNLVLSDGTRADSVPNLEIETGEVVGAGHASATGRFDDEQLFYLGSRGIDPVTARRLVVRGFFAEIINSVESESLRSELWTIIDDEIDAMVTQ